MAFSITLCPCNSMKKNKKIKTGIQVFLGVISLSYAQKINDFLFLLIE